MQRRSRLGLLASALGLAAVAAAGTQQPSKAADADSAMRLLVKAFDRYSPKNIVAIMRMGLQNAATKQTVRVQIAKNGNQRVEVVEPLPQSGIVILEHDDIREVFNPDKHTLSIGRSMSANMFSPSERLRLVRRNYNVTLTRHVRMAQRNVVRIDAMSKYREVGGFDIYIDPDSYFVMRVDGVSMSGTRVKRFETMSVAYPDELPPDTFNLSVRDAKVTRESDPVPSRTLEAAARKAGFHPLAPGALPFGFVIRELYWRADARYATISFDISDGLAAATVFEFDLSHSPITVRDGIRAARSRHPDDYLQVGDIVVGIVSDLGPAARRKLLKAFGHTRHHTEREAEKVFNGASGPALSSGFGTFCTAVLVMPFRSVWRSSLECV